VKLIPFFYSHKTVNIRRRGSVPVGVARGSENKIVGLLLRDN